MMSNENIRAGVDALRDLFILEMCDNERPLHRISTERGNHCAYMLDQIEAFVAEGRREKAMRWLGFVQGVAWSHNLATIDELNRMNAPESPEVA